MPQLCSIDLASQELECLVGRISTFAEIAVFQHQHYVSIGGGFSMTGIGVGFPHHKRVRRCTHGLSQNVQIELRGVLLAFNECSKPNMPKSLFFVSRIDFVIFTSPLQASGIPWGFLLSATNNTINNL